MHAIGLVQYCAAIWATAGLFVFICSVMWGFTFFRISVHFVFYFMVYFCTNQNRADIFHCVSYISEVIVSVSVSLDVGSHSIVCTADRVQCLIFVTDWNWSHYNCVLLALVFYDRLVVSDSRFPQSLEIRKISYFILVPGKFFKLFQDLENPWNVYVESLSIFTSVVVNWTSVDSTFNCAVILVLTLHYISCLFSVMRCYFCSTLLNMKAHPRLPYLILKAYHCTMFQVPCKPTTCLNMSL